MRPRMPSRTSSTSSWTTPSSGAWRCTPRETGRPTPQGASCWTSRAPRRSNRCSRETPQARQGGRMPCCTPGRGTPAFRPGTETPSPRCPRWWTWRTRRARRPAPPKPLQWRRQPRAQPGSWRGCWGEGGSRKTTATSADERANGDGRLPLRKCLPWTESHSPRTRRERRAPGSCSEPRSWRGCGRASPGRWRRRRTRAALSLPGRAPWRKRRAAGWSGTWTWR
mmetsp:Transcript_5527/g.23430  ORF Transcript_5527/g.23430 Transcript_5527/m.23430 type:complete len:224 (+) Transcript_5527:2368-3039(+)